MGNKNCHLARRLSDLQIDDALRFIKDQENGSFSNVGLSIIDEKQLVQKVDLTVMPFMIIIFTLQSLDKTLSMAFPSEIPTRIRT
jgi:hypothetical protein